MAKRDNIVGWDWDLGALERISPECLLSRERGDGFDEFFLALALVFNDLKNIVLLTDVVSRRGCPDGISPEIGQRSGLSAHLLRLTMGILHEFLTLLRENKDIVEDPRLSRLLATLPNSYRKNWRDLVTESLGGTTSSAVLAMVRNSVAFHYYQPRALADGYRACFFSDPTTDLNRRAFVSRGNDMDAMRFYYADAASQRSATLLAQRKGLLSVDQLLEKFINDTNFALSHLVCAYIDERRRHKRVAV